MNIQARRNYNLIIEPTPLERIYRFRIELSPFIIRELKIGSLLYLSSGITYIKILTEPIPEITPKIKVDIGRISYSELLNSNLTNLAEFFPNANRKRIFESKDNMECFIATRDKELVCLNMLGYARGRRLMILGTRTLERFRGNHINSAVLVYIMKYNI